MRQKMANLQSLIAIVLVIVFRRRQTAAPHSRMEADLALLFQGKVHKTTKFFFMILFKEPTKIFNHFQT